MHLKLMIPGPIELENEVLEQMGAPNTPHYGDEWVTIHNETVEMLKQLFGTTGSVFMMPGSGSLGLDAAIHSAFAPGDQVAVGVNGFFGTRLTEVLNANGVITVPIEAEPDHPLDPANFARALEANPAIVGVAVVHLETSTAVLNPIRDIARVARTYDRLCFVDAISSLAGTELHMDDWGIDLCVSASQKGAGGAPGLAFVAVGKRGWEAIDKQAGVVRSWYLDLRRWRWYTENWGDWHPHPVTMPTAVTLGLRVALQSLMREGFDNRIERYQQIAKRLRDGLEALDMPLFVPASLMSPVLTTAFCPTGVKSGEIINYLEAKHRIKITSGFQQYKDRVIRIGHMGGAITEADIDLLLAGLREFLHERDALAASTSEG